MKPTNLDVNKFCRIFETRIEEVLDNGKKRGVTERFKVKELWEGLMKSKECISGATGFKKEVLQCRYKGAPEKETGRGVHEFLLDFSMSSAFPRVYEQKGEQPLPQGEKFQLNIAAESEMGTKDEVARDLLKLLIVRCHIKVLLYRRRVRKAELEKLKEKLERVFDRNVCDPTQDMWLVIGVPTYPKWRKKGSEAKLDQVYTLKRRSGSPALVLIR